MSTTASPKDKAVILFLRMKQLLIAVLLLFPAVASAAFKVVASSESLPVPPKAPVLLAPQIVSSTEIRWRFRNREPKAVAYELWDAIGRQVISRLDDPKAAYIAETNIVPADPDMACGRYIVAVTADDRRSYGQISTYPCVRTPPVAPPPPKVEIIDKNIIKITISPGTNDPAVAIGVLELNRGAWVSPSSMFIAHPEMLTSGQWGTDMGTMIIGLRSNSSYTFRAVVRSVTGEVSPYSAPISIRMPAEKGEAFAPSLDRIGESGGLFGMSINQTPKTKNQRPVIAGIVNGTGVTVTLDDRPYLAKISGNGEIKNFTFAPESNIGSGYHYLRLGAHRDGTVAWTPTIEFVVK
jgi:hypothetical protein